jgi:8-oxo-dGTP diphosphatase
MPYTPILATLGYVLSPDGRRVLLIHRNRRPQDPHFGKYNGLGGKLDAAEDVVAGLRREVREESGLE